MTTLHSNRKWKRFKAYFHHWRLKLFWLAAHRGSIKRILTSSTSNKKVKFETQPQHNERKSKKFLELGMKLLSHSTKNWMMKFFFLIKEKKKIDGGVWKRSIDFIVPNWFWWNWLRLLSLTCPLRFYYDLIEEWYMLSILIGNALVRTHACCHWMLSYSLLTVCCQDFLT